MMKLRLVEALSEDKEIPLDYDDVEIQVSRGTDYWDGPLWDDIKVSWTYYASEAEIAEAIMDYVVDDLSVEDYDKMTSNPDGEDAFLQNYIEQNFDSLFTKYYRQILNLFRSNAEDEAAEEYDDWDD